VDGSNGVYYGGSFVIHDGAQFIQEGGLTVITPTVELYGTINATNATMNLGALNMGDPYAGTSGNVYQSGGTVLSGVLTMDIGNYTLLGVERSMSWTQPLSHFPPPLLTTSAAPILAMCARTQGFIISMTGSCAETSCPRRATAVLFKMENGGICKG